jgi:CubicO group peptidase (beta-lactamase class C family)
MTGCKTTSFLAGTAILLAFGAHGALARAASPEPRAAANEADAASSLYFPPATGKWETVTPAKAGWDAKALDAAIAYAGEQRSSGIVVLHQGRIVGERYWELPPNPDDPVDRVHRMTTGRTADGQAIEDVASMQKSFMSFLAGVARGKGLLDFEAPVSRYLGAGWSKATPAQEAAILVRHVLGMASGLKLDGSYEAPPGTKWLYNTPIYAKTVQIVEKASGLSVDQYTRQWLTERIGMLDSKWTPREWVDDPAAVAAGSREGNTIGFSTTARDAARFGLMILAGGRWKDEDVLGDPRYLAEAFASSQSHNPSYGLLWWLNGKAKSPQGGGKMGDGPLIPSAPPDLVAAQGALGRKIYVVPSLDLVVTRLGDEPAKDFNTELWRRLSAAAPKR